jgi:hypothetical protein
MQNIPTGLTATSPLEPSALFIHGLARPGSELSSGGTMTPLATDRSGGRSFTEYNEADTHRLLNRALKAASLNALVREN